MYLREEHTLPLEWTGFKDLRIQGFKGNLLSFCNTGMHNEIQLSTYIWYIYIYCMSIDIFIHLSTYIFLQSKVNLSQSHEWKKRGAKQSVAVGCSSDHCYAEGLVLLRREGEKARESIMSYFCWQRREALPWRRFSAEAHTSLVPGNRASTGWECVWEE